MATQIPHNAGFQLIPYTRRNSSLIEVRTSATSCCTSSTQYASNQANKGCGQKSISNLLTCKVPILHQKNRCALVLIMTSRRTRRSNDLSARHLFGSLKRHLGGTRFTTNEEFSKPSPRKENMCCICKVFQIIIAFLIVIY